MTFDSVFMAILRMSVIGGVLILVLLPVRLGLKKAPKIYSYILWASVLFRLLCPAAIPVSVRMPDLRAEQISVVETVSTETLSEAESVPESAPVPRVSQSTPYAAPQNATPFEDAPLLPAAAPAIRMQEEIRPAEPVEASEPVHLDPDRLLHIAEIVWIGGALVLFAWNACSLLGMRRRMVGMTPMREEPGVWLADYISTAFVWGVLSPKVILPSSLKGRARSYVIRHERVHIRRGDPLWRRLAFIALLVHWFNPLVWLAFRLSGKDMEMSCDEAVMRQSEGDIRADYSETLLRFTAAGLGPGTALAFGEGETGSRVKNVMRYRKPALRVSLAAALVLVTTAAVFAINPTAMDTRLPNTRYTFGPVLYDPVGGSETMLRETYGGVELAGDGTLSLYVNETNHWTILGASVDCTEEAASLYKSFRGTTGIRVKEITEARFVPAEEGEGGWLIACDGSGRVYLASARLGEDGRLLWVCSLKHAREKNSLWSSTNIASAGFSERSLKNPVGRPVTVIAESRGTLDRDYTLVLFTAEEDGSHTPGLALFELFDGGRAERLTAWALADGVTTGESAWDPEMRLEEDVFTVTLPDGGSLSAEIELPVKTKDFFGRVTSVSGGSVTFLNLPEKTDEEIKEELFREYVDELVQKMMDERKAQLEREAAQEAEEEQAKLEALIQEQAEFAAQLAARAQEEADRAAAEAYAHAEQLRREEELIAQAARDDAERAELLRLITEREEECARLRERMPAAEVEMSKYREMAALCDEQIQALEGQQPEKAQKLREKLEQKKAEAEAALAAVNAELGELNRRAAEANAALGALKERLAAHEDATSPRPADPSVTDSAGASVGAGVWNNPSAGWIVDNFGLPIDTRDPDDIAADLAYVRERMVFPLPAGVEWRMRYVSGVAGEEGKARDHIAVIGVEAGTPVLAVRDGVVERSADEDDVGGQILIRHADGTCSVYQYLSERYVKIGDPVARGVVIGRTGCDPRDSLPAFRVKIALDCVLYTGELYDALPVVEAQSGGRTTEFFSDPSGEFNALVDSAIAGQGTDEPIDLADRDVSFPLPEDAAWTVLSEYGWRDRYGTTEYHFGMDFAASKEGADVLAYTGGKVIVSGYHSAYGNYVILSHGGDLTTLYAHLGERFVEVGDSVKTGEPIGTVGLSGSTYANGLHFEVRSGGAARDPRGFLPGM